MRKPLISLTAALLLIISLIAVSCAPAQMQDSDSDTIYVYFGNLEAKAVDETAYTSEGKVENGTSSVTIGDVNDYFWAYSAVKADNLFTKGATYQKGGTQTFANCAEGTGLGSARPFSKGAWTFELRAYASVADRNAGTQYLFSGKTTTESLTKETSVAIPVTYSYIAGEGTASFTISTEVKQVSLTGHKAYEITGVNAIIDGTTKVTLSDSDNDGKWTGTKTKLASGVKTIGLEVFVDSETTARASTDKLTSAIILHGMTTEISGKATVTLTGATMTIDFNGTSLPSTQPTEDGLLTKAPSTVKVGDVLEIGTYPSTAPATYAGQPVTWKVLAVSETNRRALVISENILENRAIDSDSSCASYKDSDIRTYLSGDFITDYGLSNVSICSTLAYSDYKINIDEASAFLDGKDKAFLLCREEATTYFSDNASRVATYNGTAGSWWLRSPSSFAGNYYYVFSGLENDTQGAGVVDYTDKEGLQLSCTTLNGIRPAFFLNMESGGGN